MCCIAKENKILGIHNEGSNAGHLGSNSTTSTFFFSSSYIKIYINRMLNIYISAKSLFQEP